VLGVERDPQAVADARVRAASVGADNVEFRVGDVQTLDGVHDTFDAVVGRLILMYLSDPVAALRRATERIRPGGLVIAHEGDLAYDWAAPQSAQWRQVREWMLRTLEQAGVDARMGLRLYRCFIEAGLRAPTMTLEATVAGGTPPQPGDGRISCGERCR
jgi:SAM-dependent methyltransferase